MIIEKANILNYRNIVEIQVEPGKKLNFILGDNAQGKTNFVEALYFTTFLKSFRTNKNVSLIRQDQKEGLINIKVENNKVSNDLKVKIEKNKKTVEINKSLPDKYLFYKLLNIIIFHPDEVNYISSYPIYRRNLVDRSIFYKDNTYIDLCKNYNRCLKQRNSYLKKNENIYDSWKVQLISYGAKIIEKRLYYIDCINSIFDSDNFNSIKNESYKIKYSRDIYNIKNIENILSEEFYIKEEKEKHLGYTLVGPHRDDIHFYLNDKPAHIYASQGQKRSLVISFKTAQILDYKYTHDYYPVLILDDMTSELDSKRKNGLFENLLANSGQVFITSTDLNMNKISENSKVFRVNQGEISLAD